MIKVNTKYCTCLLFGRLKGIDLEVNALTTLLLTEQLWLLYSLFNRSLMLLAVRTARLDSNTLLPSLRWRMQGWSDVISLRLYATTFCRPIMTKRDLWLSWFKGMISSLYWKTFRFIFLTIPTQVSWGCAFKEKTSFLVQVSLYLKECLQNI